MTDNMILVANMVYQMMGPSSVMAILGLLMIPATLIIYNEFEENYGQLKAIAFAWAIPSIVIFIAWGVDMIVIAHSSIWGMF